MIINDCQNHKKRNDQRLNVSWWKNTLRGSLAKSSSWFWPRYFSRSNHQIIRNIQNTLQNEYSYDLQQIARKKIKMWRRNHQFVLRGPSTFPPNKRKQYWCPHVSYWLWNHPVALWSQSHKAFPGPELQRCFCWYVINPHAHPSHSSVLQIPHLSLVHL